MKKIILIILFFFVKFTYSQNFENINKFRFVYSVGGSSWGKNGIYSRSEIFELTKTEIGDFKISKQIKVNKKDKTVKSWKVWDKNGKRKVFRLDKFTPNVPATDSQFTFDKKAHPGVEIVDLR